MGSQTKYKVFKLTILAILVLILVFIFFFRYQGQRRDAATSWGKRTVKIDFVFPDKDGVIGATEETPAQNIRVLIVAVLEYQVKYKSLPRSLSSLGPPPKGKEANCDAANLIDPRLALGSKNGYVFQYSRNLGSFTITADPGGGGTPNSFHYFSDQTGVVRAESGRAATIASRPYEQD